MPQIVGVMPAPESDTRRPSPTRAGAGAVVAIAVAALVQAAVVLGVVWIANNEQRIADQFAVWRFVPDATITAYADAAGLTDEGRFLFYASQPRIESGDAFTRACGASSEEFGILGCYLPATRGITLYDVTDERLAGLEEVVATHELLHAVWDRLPSAERDALAVLLDAEAQRHADEPEFAETLAFYAEAEPGQRYNELHSIIGTEFDDLDPALEAHYARYVHDRAVVVALHRTSSAVFEQFEARAGTLVAQLEDLGAAIDADYATYTAEVEALNADIEAFNRRADAGDFGSQAQFEAERNALLARGDELDAFYATIDARAAEYGVLLSELDAINAELAVLNEAINIDPPHVPELDTGT